MISPIVFHFIRGSFYNDAVVSYEIGFILVRIKKNVPFLFLLDGILLAICQTDFITVLPRDAVKFLF